MSVFSLDVTKMNNGLENGLDNRLSNFLWKASLYHCNPVLVALNRSRTKTEAFIITVMLLKVALLRYYALRLKLVLMAVLI